MSALTLEPRVASDTELDEIEALERLVYEDLSASSPQACVETCVSGFTIKCDGKTFTKTCVTGLTIRCDG